MAWYWPATTTMPLLIIMWFVVHGADETILLLSWRLTLDEGPVCPARWSATFTHHAATTRGSTLGNELTNWVSQNYTQSIERLPIDSRVGQSHHIYVDCGEAPIPLPLITGRNVGGSPHLQNLSSLEFRAYLVACTLVYTAKIMCFFRELKENKTCTSNRLLLVCLLIYIIFSLLPACSAA